MANSIYDKINEALKQAGNHNSQVMVRPEVILWPDPESHWREVIPVLQETLPQLLVYGPYNPDCKQGPAIWIKCMVARALPEADWNPDTIPIIYLAGVSKLDLSNVENAVFDFQPLLEYQYTGALFTQENGREWSILAIVENPVNGLGIKVAKDQESKDALRKTLPTIFQDPDVLANRNFIDADFLNNQLFPDIVPSILKWMCKGESFLQGMDEGKRAVFSDLCKSQYEFQPDHRNIKAIAEKLGSQKNNWKYVWQLFATAPHKYPEMTELLRLAKPTDLGIGVFAVPHESWPQVNEEQEEALATALQAMADKETTAALNGLRDLENRHGMRRAWVWAELGLAPLAQALHQLTAMADAASESYPSASVEALQAYYTSEGFQVDQHMRKALAAVKTERDKELVTAIIRRFYQPWLENLTNKFQRLIEQDASVFTAVAANEVADDYILFVDAFRYELAEEFSHRLQKQQLTVSLEAGWSAIPSLTPTAKPHMSPIRGDVSEESKIDEFRPLLKTGQDLQTAAFREAVKARGYQYVARANDIQTATGKYWQEIGDIDTKGHEEQANMVRRVEELFEQVQEALDTAFERGVRRVRIVTDHGWLLLPGGLPKTQLNASLTETRWGRCALIKEGANTDLLHLPWRWNPAVYIAYAPGISFFKANEAYAHGGISIHECLTPTLLVENNLPVNMNAQIKVVRWVKMKCTIETNEVPDTYTVDIRTKFSDPSTSVLFVKNKNLANNSVTVTADGDKEHEAATIVLLDENGRILDKKPTTIGG